MAIHNCSECDYCYSNETMGELHICVNGKSEMLGQAVDYLGLADDDMDCVVINGKDRDEINEEEYERLDDIEKEEYNRMFEDEPLLVVKGE